MTAAILPFQMLTYGISAPIAGALGPIGTKENHGPGSRFTRSGSSHLKPRLAAGLFMGVRGYDPGAGAGTEIVVHGGDDPKAK